MNGKVKTICLRYNNIMLVNGCFYTGPVTGPIGLRTAVIQPSEGQDNSVTGPL